MVSAHGKSNPAQCTWKQAGKRACSSISISETDDIQINEQNKSIGIGLLYCLHPEFDESDFNTCTSTRILRNVDF